MKPLWQVIIWLALKLINGATKMVDRPTGVAEPTN